MGNVIPPLSGTYKGRAYERDRWMTTHQNVQTTLKFHKDGMISGKGRDYYDGHYSVKGHWKALVDDDEGGSDEGGRGYLLRWNERYSDFTVDVQCEMKVSMVNGVKSASIEGEFKSSLYIFG